MKKLIISLVAAWFVAAGSGLVFADQATSVSTPAAKSMKHKKFHKKWVKKGKKATKPSTTPTAK